MLILLSRLLLIAAVWRAAEGKTPLPYGSDGACNNAASEYYVKSQQICCSKCKPGTRLKNECNSNLDTVCETCPDGHYSEKLNHFQNCFSCQKCQEVKGLKYERKCSPDANAVCTCAEPGMFCSKKQNNECQECRKHRSCKPGQYVSRAGTLSSDVKCASCPNGNFSDHINADECKPHTQCEGRLVLKPGNLTTDTLCERITAPPTTTTTTTTTTKLHSPTLTMTMITATTSPTTPSISMTSSKSSPLDLDQIYYIVIVACALVLLTLAAMVLIAYKLRKRKVGLHKVPITDANKEQDVSAGGTSNFYQCLLPGDRCPKEPSMTSSDSQSQPDSSHSSADWLERTSQEESIPEQPSVSSPLVNVSITATFNCQLTPTAASCSIPLNTSTRTPHVEAPVPLSQEEVCISCQQEDGKEALQSVQESGLCDF